MRSKAKLDSLIEGTKDGKNEVKDFYTLAYDTKKRLKEYVLVRDKKVLWRKEYDYNINDSLVFYQMVDKDCNTLRGNSRVDSFYYENNRLVKTVSYQDGRIADYKTYSYDSNSMVVKLYNYYYYLINEAEMDYSRYRLAVSTIYHYSFDSAHNLLYYKRIFPSDTFPQEEIVLKYDASNRLISKEMTSFSSLGKKRPAERHFYSYTSKGNLRRHIKIGKNERYSIEKWKWKNGLLLRYHYKGFENKGRAKVTYEAKKKYSYDFYE